MYDAPKPKPIKFNNDVLAEFDKFSFGSKIGAITNKSTSAIALLPVIEKEYGVESKEYKVLLNRIRMCTKLQNSEIDKTKIGQKMKGIPKIWTDRKYIDSLDLLEEDENLLKTLLLDRHPYFFIHLYNDTKRQYVNHTKKYDVSSQNMFGLTLDQLINKENKTDEEQKVVDLYKKYNPVIDSDSVMNNICKYVEFIDESVKEKLKKIDNKETNLTYLMLMRNNYKFDEISYKKVVTAFKEFKKELSSELILADLQNKNKYDGDTIDKFALSVELFKEKFDTMCEDITELVDYLIMAYYVDVPTENKLLLWEAYGDIILNNLKLKCGNKFLFPFPDENGEIEYLNKRFKLFEVEV